MKCGAVPIRRRTVAASNAMEANIPARARLIAPLSPA
jgi:hypothetical protein